MNFYSGIYQSLQIIPHDVLCISIEGDSHLIKILKDSTQSFWMECFKARKVIQVLIRFQEIQFHEISTHSFRLIKKLKNSFQVMHRVSMNALISLFNSQLACSRAVGPLFYMLFACTRAVSSSNWPLTSHPRT